MKRRGVIAALFGGVFTTNGIAQASAKTFMEITLPHGPQPDYSKYPCHDEGKLFYCDPPPTIPEPEYALVVHYGDRVVRLTAAEVMDALEGK